MDERPLVSVLTPSYNQGRFTDCIASVASYAPDDLRCVSQ